MKSSIFLAALLSAIFTGCSSASDPFIAEGIGIDGEATIVTDLDDQVQLSGADRDVLILLVESGKNHNVAYQVLPETVPIQFWREGLLVTFTARVYPIPPNVRMQGRPTEVLAIQIR